MNVLGICPYGAHRSKGMSSLLSSMSVHNIRSIATLSVVHGVLLPESVPFVMTGIFVLSLPLAFYRFAGRSIDIGPPCYYRKPTNNRSGISGENFSLASDTQTALWLRQSSWEASVGNLSHFYCICIVLFLIAGGGHRVRS
jgi:hypothetical protein